MTEKQAMEWHSDFERYSPEQHQHLLVALGMKPDEINKMREYYRNYK